MTSKQAPAKNGKMKRKRYEKEMRELQVELCHLQEWVKQRAPGSSSCSRVATPPARVEPSRRSPSG